MQTRIFSKPHGVDLQQELQRLACLEAVCSETGLAITAPVLGVDADRREIHYVHLDGLEPLTLAAGQDGRCFHALGELLAGMHRSRPLVVTACERDLDWEKSQLELAGIGADLVVRVLDEFPAGFAHGDLWHGNVLRREGAWVILDPIPSGVILQGVTIHASGIFDLAYIHMSLFACRQLRDFFADAGAATNRYGQALLEGYLGCSDSGWALPAVLQLSQALALQWRDAYSRRLAMPVALLKQRMFERNFRAYYMGNYEAS